MLSSNPYDKFKGQEHGDSPSVVVLTVTRFTQHALVSVVSLHETTERRPPAPPPPSFPAAVISDSFPPCHDEVSGSAPVALLSHMETGEPAQERKQAQLV
ncbi:unnamed protein product [Pleuronectes platessa]|uniref:Uncharacterized protein n=1 Tax=Pleuronectes platessa TaxID=8262 RepID=A0A9N7UGK4_PLEPL|nr:unnamed protein product [Pleuronectes platessa]